MAIKVGIIGCGGIARAHADAYTKKNAKVVAVTDSNVDAANNFAGELGASVFPDYRALIDQGDVEVVSICTPPVVHEDAAVYALNQGVNVLCEKPLAWDVPAALRIRAAVRQSPALLMPAFRHRFLPANIALRDLVASGTLGDPVFFLNTFCGPAFQMEERWFTRKAVAGGGCLLDTNSHSVDLFRFIIGEIDTQAGVMHRHFKTTDVEDAGVLCVKAGNGTLGTMRSAFVAGVGMATIEITGTKGQAVYDYTDPAVVRHKLTADKDWTISEVQPSNGFAEEVGHLLGAIAGRHELSCTVDDGVRCMEVICGVY